MLPAVLSLTAPRPALDLVSWEADEPHEVKALSLNFSIDRPNIVAAPAAIYQAALLVAWGSAKDGASFSAELDFVRSGNLFVQGSYINVTARNDSDVTADTPLTQLRVSCGLGFGGAPGKGATIHPTRTIGPLSLIAGPVTIAIPPFSKTVDFVRTNFLTSIFSAEFLAHGGLPPLGGVQVGAGGQLGRELQIPQGSQSVLLTNVADTSRLMVMFGLDL